MTRVALAWKGHGLSLLKAPANLARLIISLFVHLANSLVCHHFREGCNDT
jgi:hypothetical protein